MASKALFHLASSLSTFPSAHQLLWLPHPLLSQGLPTSRFLCLKVISPLDAELAVPLSTLSNCHLLGEVFIVRSIQWRPCPCPFDSSALVCFFHNTLETEFTDSIPVCSQCLVCLSHSNISSRRDRNTARLTHHSNPSFQHSA